jgi:AraC family transcriptional regulator, positive regulator of tynA and feaB
MEHKTDVGESAVATARRAQIKLYIENRLRDSDLSPASVAEHFGVSSRYIRMLFAGEGESCSAYILRRRLEECAQQMISPLWQGHTITETAFRWGFNSLAHFTRAFRDHYGVTPGEYRRTHRKGEALAG